MCVLGEPGCQRNPIPELMAWTGTSKIRFGLRFALLPKMFFCIGTFSSSLSGWYWCPGPKQLCSGISSGGTGVVLFYHTAVFRCLVGFPWLLLSPFPTLAWRQLKDGWGLEQCGPMESVQNSAVGFFSCLLLVVLGRVCRFTFGILNVNFFFGRSVSISGFSVKNRSQT